MRQFRLRSGRLRGADNWRLRGEEQAVAEETTVGSGSAVAGVTPDIRRTTWGNPSPRPRVMLPIGGVTVVASPAILDVGAPVVAPGLTQTLRIVSPSPRAPRVIHAETRPLRVVGSLTQKTRPTVGSGPHAPTDVIAAPDTPEEVVSAPQVPKPRIVGRTGRSK